MRKPIIAGNHKMNLVPAQTVAFLTELGQAVTSTNDVQVIVCPPFTSLAFAEQSLGNSGIELGAQNVHFAEKGAFTGEISAEMLRAINCLWVICGHSERRHLFGETNKIVNSKIKAVLKAEMKPILCVGETLAERQQGITEKVLEEQLRGSLEGLELSGLTSLVIAYEPVWAIGTGQTATPQDAESGCGYLRTLLSEMYGSDFAESVRILYGGSVKPHNINILMNEMNVDGALVGGASLKSADFAAIVNYNV